MAPTGVQGGNELENPPAVDEVQNHLVGVETSHRRRRCYVLIVAVVLCVFIIGGGASVPFVLTIINQSGSNRSTQLRTTSEPTVNPSEAPTGFNRSTQLRTREPTVNVSEAPTEEKRNSCTSSTGIYTLENSIEVYCHSGWTLIGRFSNNDAKNWMRDDGFWWYDVMTVQGNTTNTSANQDMISPAFWLVNGSEIKITRSDDPTHTALLRTTSNCLGSRTFRSKITSYGNFRHGTTWGYAKCLGNCSVVYGGQYLSTDGFSQARCSSDIQNSDGIGFWCHWSADGAVMMIGGGGSACARADHGIGITEDNSPDFSTIEVECDFGDVLGEGSGICQNSSYALNLWIR